MPNQRQFIGVNLRLATCMEIFTYLCFPGSYSGCVIASLDHIYMSIPCLDNSAECSVTLLSYSAPLQLTHMPFILRAVGKYGWTDTAILHSLHKYRTGVTLECQFMLQRELHFYLATPVTTATSAQHKSNHIRKSNHINSTFAVYPNESQAITPSFYPGVA